MSTFDPSFASLGMDPGALPAEIQARLSGPTGPPPLPTDQWPVNVPTQRLGPSQQPGGSYGDRLAALLAGVETPRPDSVTGQTPALAAFLAGLAHGFSATRLGDIRSREATQAALNSAAALQNKRQWDAAQQSERDRISALKTLSANSPAAKGAAAKATEAGKLSAQKEAGAGLFGKPASTYTVTPADVAKNPKLAAYAGKDLSMDDAARFGLVPPKESPAGGGGGLFGGPPQADIVKNIADAIERGDQPPITTGLYRYGGPVKGELGARKFNQSKALTEWTAIQRETASLNNPQQTQTRQAAATVLNSYDLIDELATRLGELAPQTRVIPINKLVNMAIRDFGPNGEEAQKVALNLRSAVADAVPLQANVYMAGGVPSEQAMKQAGVTISGDRSPSLILNDTKLQRRLMNYRLTNIGGTTAQQPANLPWNPPGAAPAMTGAPGPFGPKAGATEVRVRVKGPNGEIGTQSARRPIPAGWQVVQ